MLVFLFSFTEKDNHDGSNLFPPAFSLLTSLALFVLKKKKKKNTVPSPSYVPGPRCWPAHNKNGYLTLVLETLWVIHELCLAFILLTPFWFFPLLNICCNLALRATGWMSGHKRGKKRKEKAAETTQECHPAIQSARPGQAKCRRATSLWSAPWQSWTLDAPWHSAAKPDHVSLFWWENQTNGSLEVYFSAANLLSKHRELHNSARAHVHVRTRARTHADQSSF